MQRVSDITLADFWNYSPTRIKFRSYRKGTSLILLNTAKGKKLFDNIKRHLIYEERSITEALNSNHNLQAPQPKPELLDEFWNDYNKGIDKSILQKKYLIFQKEQGYRTVVKGYIKMIFPSFILRRILK